jgi:hypothetical protein
VGAIAGGVVGGALGILALILLVFFCLRRRRQTEDFDGNFDPDRLDTERLGGSAARPGPMPDVDLVGAEISPFTVQSQPSPQKGYDPYPQMAQSSGMSGHVVSGGGGSGYGRSDTTGSHYPTTVTDPSVPGMPYPEFRSPSPGPSLGTTGTPPSSKDRELINGGRRLQVSNEQGEGGSGQGSNNLVQHLDGGRLQQQVVPEEIPPSYDSISPEERAAAGRS